MAFKIAEAWVEIRGDDGRYKGSIKAAKRDTAAFAKSATANLKKVAIGLAAIGAAATVAAVAIGVKLARAIINVGKATITTAISYDKLKIGLTAVTGSAAETERQLQRLRVLAQDPGLGFKQAIQGSINLQAAGLSAQLAERSLSAFGNALAVVGKGADDLAGVSLALTQIANKTSGFGQDIRQLQERLPQMQTALQNAFDGKPVEDLSITGKELIAALVIEFEKLEKAGASVGNNITNLGTSFDLLKKSIGDKLIGATDDVVVSLTGIIDKLTLVVENYELFRDDVAKIMIDISIIGIKTTGIMLVSMAKIIGIAGKTMFKPLIAGWKIALLEIVETSLPFSNIVAVLEKVPKIGDDIARAYNKAADPIRAMFDTKQAEIWKKTMDEAGNDLATAMTGIFAEARVGFDAMLKGLGQIDLKLKGIADKGPKEIIPEESTKKATSAVFDLANTLKGLKFVFDANKDAVAAFGNVTTEHFANAVGAIDRGKEAARGLGDATREAMENIRQQTQETINIIAPAFEDMFTDLFSGNTKSLWENFWSDLKRIAIRQMAQIFAAQILGGIFTGGASFAGAGIGAIGSNFGRGFGNAGPAASSAGRGLSRVGGFLEGGTLIVNDQDLGNLDQQRLQRQLQALESVSQQAKADGI